MNANHWLNNLPDYLPATDVTIIRKAYDIANAAHTGQMRKSGEPYITHSLAVAKLLTDLHMDGETIAAGLLHDVPEDTEVTLQELQETFGPIIANLVGSVTKLKHTSDFGAREMQNAPPRKKEDQRAENLRRMFLGMGEDTRAVIIKLADRLHNMRTLNHMPREKQIEKAQETLEIFAPLANRLGVHTFKRDLEDLAFKYLYPEEYRRLARALKQSRDKIDTDIKRIAAEMQDVLTAANVDAQVSSRSKHLYSIYVKMQRKAVELESVYDVKALRLIVKDVKDCYHALGVVHTNWRPISREFDDYIANPKPNGYQSLHTAVRDQNGNYFEVQIRTEEMHELAEYGIAAHWRYKDGTRYDEQHNQIVNTQRQHLTRQNLRFREEVTNASEDAIDASEFVDAVRNDVMPDQVYVFSPKGDVFELPQGSTPIDFAYCVHTEVGHKCRGAKIDGNLVSLDYQLQNGDRVEIIAAKRGGPSRDWLNENLGYIRTNRAEKKIRQWFRKQNYQVSVQQGRTMLDRELKRLHITSVRFEDISQALKYNKVDDFLAAIGYSDLSIQQVIRQALALTKTDQDEDNDLLEQSLAEMPVASKPAPPTELNDVRVMDVGSLLTNMASCCNPVPGDPIIGYVTRGRGVTIHRQDCPNALRLRDTDRDRLITVTWSKQGTTGSYSAKVVVKAFDRRGLARDVTDVIAREDINIGNLSVKTHSKDNTADIHLTLQVEDLIHLHRVMDRLEQLPNIIEVIRIS